MNPYRQLRHFVPRWIIITLVLSARTGIAADAPQPGPYRLQSTDLAELANLVCKTRHDVPEDRITAWWEAAPPFGNGPVGAPPGAPPRPPVRNSLRASVECKPHEVTPQFAKFYTANCVRTTGWQCARSEVLLRADIANHPVTIRTNGYNAELAHDLVTRVFAYRTHKGDPAFNPDTAHCSLGRSREKDMLDINCDGHVVRLSYWCPQSNCPRVFSIDGFFVPANAAGL